MVDTVSRKREAEAEERVTKRRKTEIPKAVKRYLVSNMGRVQSKGRKITPKVNKGHEYPAIQIKGRKRQLAEIVLLTFGLPRPSPQHTVGHTNGKLKSDASLEGLAWQDKKEQRADQKKHKMRTAGVKGVKAKKDDYEEEFVSISEAARVLGLDQSIITACLKGRLKDTHGYTFEYVPALHDGEEKRPVPDHVWRDGKPVGTWYATTEGRIVSPKGAICGNEKRGYLRVGVTFPNGKTAQYFNHILVAATFHDVCPKGKTVDHIDTKSMNNHPNNLRYATPAEQNANQGERSPNGPQLSRPVEVFIEGKWKSYDSATAAARELGLPQGNVSQAARTGCRVGRFRVQFAEDKDLPNEIWKDVVTEG